ncbi:hypothetical protein [Arthrobacter sp. H-02-3]|uniref:hypothetical protein n=1 Tax=Arthrobacter sp. H-02-3 TaxID=2703675 RepID=UPI00137AE7BA|nr:hypothetical protein [Arthrobacter sp. H-02-3]
MAAIVWAGVIGTLCWLVAAGEIKAIMDAAAWLVLLSWFAYYQIPFDTVRDIEVRYTVAIWAAGKKIRELGRSHPARLLRIRL